ncbi:hypothetical protein VTN96DRAFT_1387 [Rasamsonia emersonii]
MAGVVFEDLSGTATPVSEGENPYQALIAASNNDPVQLQARYATHRTTRNAQQKAKILDPSFPGWTLDETLAKLDGPNRDPTFLDDRFCSTFWGRPPLHIRNLVDMIQRELRQVAPTLWFMPLENLHITIFELVHSVTEPEMEAIISPLLETGAAEEIVNLPLRHRIRLIKPMIGYDASAMALSFVPAAGEGRNSVSSDQYTYHHLRREVYDRTVAAGVKPVSRYIVPSAHLTIARFITQDGFVDDSGRVDHTRVRALIEKIEELNARLEAEYWPKEDGSIKVGGEWIIGQEKGVDFRKGRLWYGGGENVLVGKAF